MGRVNDICNLCAYAFLTVVSILLLMSLKVEHTLRHDLEASQLYTTQLYDDIGSLNVGNKIIEMDLLELRSKYASLERIAERQRNIISLSRRALKQWNIQNNIDFDGADERALEKPNVAISPAEEASTPPAAARRDE